MNKKRAYPLILIDRTRADSYPNDFIACLDRSVGFVARVVHFPSTEMYNEYTKRLEDVEHGGNFSFEVPLRNGGIVLLVDDFICDFELTADNCRRVQTLLKKCIKKYMHAEVERSPYDDLGIDNQIAQQELTLEQARRGYDSLLKKCASKEHADYVISLAEATLETLKNYRDNMNVISTYLN